MSILAEINLQTFIPLFEEFLTKRGWVRLKQLETFSIWNIKENPSFDTDIRLLNPKTEPYVDDIEFTEAAIKKLARYFSSSVELITQAILDESNIVKQGKISFRVIANDVIDGKIAFQDGIELLKSSRSFIENFARSAQKKRAIFNGKKTTDVTAFMNEVKLGQTQQGSYIVNVYYPIEQPSINEDLTQTSFSECVNQNMSSGLNALSDYLERRNNAHQDVGDLIQKGISTNLCESLIRLSGKNQHRDLEITVYDDNTKDKQIFTLARSNIDKIKSISTQLSKEEFYFQTYEVIGKVIERHSLSGNNDEGGRITVKMEVYGRIRSINVELDTKQYKLANQAVDQGNMLRLIGTLSIKKQRGDMTKLSRIDILNSEKLL
ncbi:hypothetical protein IXK22_11985 [Pasteurella multocida]|uniref:hypothetical protein n=1 Tax=Pasteurella multocida TaxID=747 RepID=UPI0018988996|nr:hypothetical protein [Pasteurella multocida]MBF6981601.1 hypothetical protein [Pasteurella multocida]MDA5611797.1 hypothetical protein [Pasteurella multocida]MDA5614269.1 hypothetical protein [Pasteurella multocida]MDA5620639.1 hypothetical protein [Pasteurella multocida subsp. multocida]